MDVRIGITNVTRELTIESDEEPAEVRSTIDEALSDDDGVLWLADRDGRQIGIPVNKLAYVELGSPDGGRRIGFAAE